ncbi:MAG TPA: ATP-binding protein [Rhodothermales bacterium]|nr:ATP-binding protein [Rhodothermales bacterium]
MHVQELTQLISLGEGSALEFKRKVPRPDRIAKEVIAFANTHGGRLLLGVDDDGTITGVRDAEEEEYALRQALRTHCEPPVEYTIERLEVAPRRDVILVSVPESSSKPHYLISETDGSTPTAYVRVADMSVEASREALRIMRTEKHQASVLFEFGEKEQILMRYLETYGQITVEQFATLANIPKRLASQTLVLLTRANVLRLHADPKQDFFTLAYALP